MNARRLSYELVDGNLINGRLWAKFFFGNLTLHEEVKWRMMDS